MSSSSCRTVLGDPATARQRVLSTAPPPKTAGYLPPSGPDRLAYQEEEAPLVPTAHRSKPAESKLPPYLAALNQNLRETGIPIRMSTGLSRTAADFARGCATLYRD